MGGEVGLSLEAASVGQRLKRAPQIVDKLSRQPNERDLVGSQPRAWHWKIRAK